MNVQRFVGFALLGLMALSLSLAVEVKGQGAQGAQTKTGTVTKVDVDGKQVTVMVARELTFTVTDATQIVQGDAPKKLADIKVNDKVTVDYVKEGETRTAKKIAILAEK